MGKAAMETNSMLKTMGNVADTTSKKIDATPPGGERRIPEGGMNRKTLCSGIAGLFLLVLASAIQAETPPADPKARLAKAEAMFQERCKKSGVFIKRTVEGVEGVFVMKVRPQEINFGDQFQMDDPYGFDVSGDGYLVNFLQGRNQKGSLVVSGGVTGGYRYVEAIDPADGKRYRYTGRIEEPWRYDGSYSITYKRFVLDKAPASGAPPRYGVTYEDISTREDRAYWIAGSSLKVIDLKSNEVIAERIGYMMDRGQGNRSGGRSPWLLAASHACPDFPKTPGGQPFKGYQTRDFVEKVLKTKEGN